MIWDHIIHMADDLHNSSCLSQMYKVIVYFPSYVQGDCLIYFLMHVVVFNFYY